MRRVDHLVQKIPIRLLLAAPLFLYIAVTLFWQAKGFYNLVGDEAHYLLISDSLVRDRDVQVDNNYLMDTPVQRASPVKLSEPIHFVPHVYNQYSRHNLGLPFILAIPYAIAGIVGAKIFMALLAGLWPLLLYRPLSRITGSPHWSALIAFTFSIGLPFAAASNQIFPDLLGGMIILYVAEKIFRALEDKDERLASLAANVWLGLLIGFLPWLHMRLIAPALLLLLGYVAAILTKSRRSASSSGHRRQWLIAAGVFAGSIILLSVYHKIAFGNFAGQYGGHSVSFVIQHIAMIFLGLHWDQAQGMFMQQPLLLLGLVGLAPLIKANWREAVLFGALYLSIILPNAMHPAWYGGASFFGRFWWTAAALWIFPLGYAVRFLLKRNELSVLLLLAGSIVLQVWLAAKWLAHDLLLVNRELPVWAMRGFYDDTGVLLRLPTFVDFDNFDLYLKHPSNYLFVLLGLLLIATGWLWQREAVRFSAQVWIVSLALGAGLFFLAPPAVNSWTLAANELSSHVGVLEGAERVATEKDGAGALVFGPYAMLLAGDYEVTLEYEWDNPPDTAAAHFDIVYGPELRLVVDRELPPSHMNNGLLKHRFTVRESQSLDPLFQFRVYYPGRGTLRVKRLTITPQ
jgi:hypothetical protein